MRYVTRASIVSTHGERNAPALHTPYDTRSTDVITTTNRQLGPDSGQVVSPNDMCPHFAASHHNLTGRRPTNYSARDGHTPPGNTAFLAETRLLARGPLNDVPIASSSRILPEHFRAWIPIQRPFRPKCRSFWSIYYVEWSPTLMLTFDNHRL